MKLLADFDAFAAELLDQIEAVQTLSRALAATSMVLEPPFQDGSDKQNLAVEMASLLEIPAALRDYDKRF